MYCRRFIILPHFKYIWPQMEMIQRMWEESKIRTIRNSVQTGEDGEKLDKIGPLWQYFLTIILNRTNI